jgi:integrase
LAELNRRDADFIEANDARAQAVRALDRLKNEHAGAISAAVQQATLATVEATTRRRGPALSVCMKAFAVEHKTKEAWTPKTADRWEVTFRHLVEGLGNVPVNGVTRDDMVAFLGRLRQLPANAQKKADLKGLDFRALTDPERPGAVKHKAIASQTINDHMTRIAGFFRWCLKIEDYNVTRNPAEGLSVAQSDVVPRKPFTLDQLDKLFGSSMWQQRKFLHPHHYWLMPIAMLTGMRLNEICQLSPKDFMKVGDVEVIKCADLADGGRRKSESATRRIPVHPELISMGLLQWVERMRKQRQSQLFPELKAGRDGHGQAPSKWFGRYKEACGITGREHVFHSFRHWFISQRLNEGVADHMIGALVGHEQGVVTTDIYWSDRDAEKLLAVVALKGIPETLMLPTLEEIRFEKIKRRPPSRVGMRKTREKRIADAAARKAKKAAAAASSGRGDRLS